MRAWVVWVAVALVSCSGQNASKLQASAAVACEVGEPFLPESFPVAPPGRVLPTADGFTSWKWRWRFTQTGELSRSDLPSEVLATAIDADVTAVLGAGGIELWKAAQRTPCVSRPGITSVALLADQVVWVESANGTDSLYRARALADGCSDPELVRADPSGFRSPTAGPGGELVVASRDGRTLSFIAPGGGVRSVALPAENLLALCGSATGVLSVTSRGIYLESPTAPRTQLRTLTSGSAFASCESGILVVSFESPEGPVVESWDGAGVLLLRNPARRVGPAGLAGGGWKQDGFIIHSANDRVLKTADASFVKDVWPLRGDAFVSYGYGPVLRWSGGLWTSDDAVPAHHALGVPDSRGEEVSLLASAQSIELLAGQTVLEQLRWYSHDERSSTIRGWVADPCSDQTVIEFQYVNSHTFFLRRGDSWRAVNLPSGTRPLTAAVDGDALIVRVGGDRVLHQQLGSEAWVETQVDVAVPADAVRVLPLGPALAVQTDAGVSFLEPGDQSNLSPAGARLVGATGKWVFVVLDDRLRALRIAD